MVTNILNVITDLALVIIFIFGFKELKELKGNYVTLKRIADFAITDLKIIRQRLADIEDKLKPPPEPEPSKEEAEQIERNQKLMQALIDEYLG